MSLTNLYQKEQFDYSQGASTYTAQSAGRLLAISAETYNIGGSGSGSAANIATTGTVVSTDSQTTSGSGNVRNSAFRASLLDVSASDTVTLSNRPYTSYAGQMHLVFQADDFDSITNLVYETVTDTNNNHKYEYTVQSDGILLCYCWNEDNYNQATDATISHSGTYSTIYENKWQVTQSTLTVGLYNVTAGDVITLECGSTATAYGTQMYAIYEVSLNSGNKDFDYTGAEQTFTAPKSGTYKLEVWGAQGGTGNTYRGGYGGYSVGLVSLTAGDTLYVNVGGQGTNGVPRTAAPGGYNGGGNGTPYTTDNNSYASGGGGCTHIAKKSGELKTLDPVDDLSDILIVAGGGGGGYYHTMGANYSAPGGDGGGYIGGTNWNNNTTYVGGGGGTQYAGGAAGTSGAAGSFGEGGTSTTYSAGGGGGYYGGGAANHRGSGAGSGYIGNGALSDKKMVTYSNQTSPDPSTYTEHTTNVSGTATEDYAKSGNGYARITLVVNPRKYLLKSGSNYYTISGGVLTNVGSTLNAQLFADYGLASIPSWSDYSSLSNPSVLCWDANEIVDMVATTTGLPTAQSFVTEGISLVVQGTDGVDYIGITDTGNPKWAFSVDTGNTWKVWSGSAWVTSSGTDMTSAEVEALTNTEWDLLTSGASAMKIRFTLTASSDGVSKIEVFYKQA